MSAIPQRTTHSLVRLFIITKVEHVGTSLVHRIAGLGARSLAYGRDNHGVSRQHPQNRPSLSTPLRVLVAPQLDWRQGNEQVYFPGSPPV